MFRLLLQLPGTNINSPLLFSHQALLENPLFAALVDQRLNGTGWTAELLSNFLYNGPPEERPAGMPPYDWRDVYNTTTRVLTMMSDFLGVSTAPPTLGPALLPSPALLRLLLLF